MEKEFSVPFWIECLKVTYKLNESYDNNEWRLQTYFLFGLSVNRINDSVIASKQIDAYIWIGCSEKVLLGQVFAFDYFDFEQLGRFIGVMVCDVVAAVVAAAAANAAECIGNAHGQMGGGVELGGRDSAKS